MVRGRAWRALAGASREVRCRGYSTATPLLQLNPSVTPGRQRLMVGLAPLGGFPKFLPEKDAVDCIRTALLNGITSFDTAPHYGLGVSEERLGLGMSELGGDLASPHLKGDDLDATVRGAPLPPPVRRRP